MPAMRTPILLVLLLAVSLHADEVVDNAAVVLRMVRAGLSADVVMTKIAQSQTTFDTSVDALIALKSEGIPDPVIKAMLLKSSAPAPIAAARGNELQSISEFLSRTHSSIAHGSCGDRAVRKLLPAAAVN